ncbi:hypothetical protein [Pseudaquabacterium pictum]|uniref:Uncharacterized protein n=1 Tax=Pseudaquabacterium pictum TaxID=2315236 RepID=A0A480AYH0_9BURK|nr:hypothetical protein [Rubrivivax pictus]GCL65167.1 hypothetical protein AQPW35_42480 [Rubrivivax pictus]
MANAQPDDTTALPLAALLAQIDATHADQPAAAVAALLARAASLPADADGARALHLAEHVALSHLGDANVLATLLAALPPALAQAPATAPSVQRLQWSLAVVQRTPAPATPPEPQRWRALQNVVLALAAQRRWAEATALLSADEAAARSQGRNEAGQSYAVAANNVAMELQTSGPAAGQPRDADRDALMLQAAAIARRAWGHAGTWRHAERAEYRLALCHAVAGQGAAARHHARLCLAACEAAGAEADATEHFFAHEALAHAHHAAGDAAANAAARAQMAALLPQIDTADGLRAWCADVLAAVPT